MENPWNLFTSRSQARAIRGGCYPYVAHYDFCRVHEALRAKASGRSRDRRSCVVVWLASATGTLIGFLRWKNGRKLKSVQEIKDSAASGSILLQVQIEGDGNTIQIPADVLKLAENKNVLDAVKHTLEPIETGNAERIEFRQDGHRLSALDKEAAKSIVRSCDVGTDPIVGAQEEPKPETVTATLHTYGPVFDTKVRNWRFRYKQKPIYADVSETSIAADAVRRGSSFMNDRYRVRMQITPPDIEDGTPHYKILEVLDFTAADQQASLPLRKPRQKPKQRGE